MAMEGEERKGIYGIELDEFTMVQKGGGGLNDSAVEIGREFERMINKYGCQVVDGILPKVTFIMKQVDSLTDFNEKLLHENQELKFQLNHWQKQDKIRKKLEADFEFTESNLIEELLKLRDENCQMKHLVNPHSKYFQCIDFQADSSNFPGPSLDSVDSLNDFKCQQPENSFQQTLQDTKRHVKELKYQIAQSVAQKTKLQEENEHLKLALHISGEEIEEMSRLIDSLDKTLAKTLKDNQEMSFSNETENCRNGRRKSSPQLDGIPLSEARKIFLERNDLKHQLEIVRQKLVTMKEEKEKDRRDKSTLQIPTIESKCTQTEELDRNDERKVEREGCKDEEFTVQGPVNREPLEKILFSNRSHSLRFKLIRWLLSGTDMYT